MRVSALFYAVLATLLYLFGMWWSVPLVLALASGITFALSHFVIRRFLRAPPPPAAAVFITGTSTGFGRMFTYDLASKGLLVCSCAASTHHQRDAVLVFHCPVTLVCVCLGIR